MMANGFSTQAGSDAVRRAAVVIAHPDDETLWCGGYILMHPRWRWRIVTLCRSSDPDRAAKFRRVLTRLEASGDMADLDDGPEQTPLFPAQVEDTVARLLGERHYDLVLTHGPSGEYTRHRRHEECCRAVVELWRLGRIDADQIWLFCYEDGGRAYLPRVRRDADRREALTNGVWLEKHRIVTELYGFPPESWEARATVREEGFRCFDSAAAAAKHVACSGEP